MSTTYMKCFVCFIIIIINLVFVCLFAYLFFFTSLSL